MIKHGHKAYLLILCLLINRPAEIFTFSTHFLEQFSRACCISRPSLQTLPPLEYSSHHSSFSPVVYNLTLGLPLSLFSSLIMFNYLFSSLPPILFIGQSNLNLLFTVLCSSLFILQISLLSSFLTNFLLTIRIMILLNLISAVSILFSICIPSSQIIDAFININSSKYDF